MPATASHPATPHVGAGHARDRVTPRDAHVGAGHARDPSPPRPATRRAQAAPKYSASIHGQPRRQRPRPKPRERRILQLPHRLRRLPGADDPAPDLVARARAGLAGHRRQFLYRFMGRGVRRLDHHHQLQSGAPAAHGARPRRGLVPVPVPHAQRARRQRRAGGAGALADAGGAGRVRGLRRRADRAAVARGRERGGSRAGRGRPGDLGGDLDHRPAADRTDLPQLQPGRALGAEVPVHRARGGVRLRFLHVRGRAAVQAARPRAVERARHRERPRRAADRDLHRPQPEVQHRHPRLARRGAALGHGVRRRQLPAADGQRGLLHPFLRRQLGQRAADRLPLRHRPAAGGAAVLGQDPPPPARVPEQALLQLQVQLPRGMAEVHPGAGRNHRGSARARGARDRHPGQQPGRHAVGILGARAPAAAGALEHARAGAGRAPPRRNRWRISWKAPGG